MYKRRLGRGNGGYLFLFLWEYIRSRIATNGSSLPCSSSCSSSSSLSSPHSPIALLPHQSSYPLGIFRGRFGTTPSTHPPPPQTFSIPQTPRTLQLEWGKRTRITRGNRRPLPIVLLPHRDAPDEDQRSLDANHQRPEHGRFLVRCVAEVSERLPPEVWLRHYFRFLLRTGLNPSRESE